MQLSLWLVKDGQNVFLLSSLLGESASCDSIVDVQNIEFVDYFDLLVVDLLWLVAHLVWSPLDGWILALDFSC